MSEVTSKSITVEDTNWIEKILEYLEDYDLLIIGGISGEYFPGFKGLKTDKRISSEADCSVARIRSNLQSPKSVLTQEEKLEFSCEEYLEPENFRYNIQVRDKDELFLRISEEFANHRSSLTEEIKKSFWEREKIQNTYIENEIAFPHGITDAVDNTRLKIFVLENPVSYTDTGEEIRICVATMGPPGERKIHLRLIGHLSSLFVEEDLKTELLDDTSPEEILRTISKNPLVEERG
jgi:mannitol/fructose-specific phosphotransferase system IIA component (Ntr-type)